MQALAHKVLGRLHFTLEQVQDLTPTPMTLSSVMFHTGENPYTHEPVYVARTQEEKRRQKAYFFNERGADGPKGKGGPSAPSGGRRYGDGTPQRSAGSPRGSQSDHVPQSKRYKGKSSRR